MPRELVNKDQNIPVVLQSSRKNEGKSVMHDRTSNRQTNERLIFLSIITILFHFCKSLTISLIHKIDSILHNSSRKPPNQGVIDIRAGNFRMVDIEINALFSIFANLETNIISRLC